MLGILAGQAIIYGPSLAGSRLLLPLDVLGNRGVYLPASHPQAGKPPHDKILLDLVFLGEPSRRFIAAEFRAGSMARWNPHQFAGAPFIVPKCSPFVLFGALTESPKIVAWLQVLVAVLSGLGAYVFCRRVLAVSFWPATISAWSYPLTGFFILWAGYALPYPVVWLPWLLVAIHGVIRNANPWAGLGVAVATFLTLVSGALDVAGQVLLASGLFALWCQVDAHRLHSWRRGALRPLGIVVGGWVLGFLLSAPDILPMLEYSRTGARMERRGAGDEERPPVGLAALPQLVLPDMYGSNERGSFPALPPTEGNLYESSSAGYTGIVATLLLAPLAWCSRRHRSINTFLVALAIFTLGWCLDVPVIVDLLRLQGLNMMSHNRFVFATSFAILCLAAVGLEVLWQRTYTRQHWFWIPAGIMGAIALWCMYRAGAPPAVVGQLRALVTSGQAFDSIRDLAGVREIETWFNRHFNMAALFSAAGAAVWLVLLLRRSVPRWVCAALPVVLMGDLLWYGYGRRAQCEPALYYPRIPVLEEIAKSAPGRVVGYNCLPARLAETHGLSDIRGYDAIDPARLTELVLLTAHPQSPFISYAMTQSFIPRATFLPPDRVQLPPILDMLGVRYVIGRGAPPEGSRPQFQSDDYWAFTNAAALPRVFIPQRVQTVVDDRERKVRLAQAEFNPRKIAYVEVPVGLPLDCTGTAEIVQETSSNIKVEVKMETPGLVVLSDLWDNGWRAYLNGQPVPILRANHAVRGVVVTAGKAELEFRYEPRSVAVGLRLAGLAAGVLLAWAEIGRASCRERV